MYGTRYGASFARFRRAMERARHRPTGLMPSFLHLDGRPRDVPRGVALSGSTAVLPALDADFAATQWRAFRGGFFGCAGGLCLVREYPSGMVRKADVDTGPIVGGWGMSATAFALAGARANGDVETAAALRRLGTLAGLPTLTPRGLHYWGGTVDLFQVLALWTRAVPMPGSRASGAAPGWGWGAAVASGWALLTFVLARTTRRALRVPREASPEGSRWQALLCALAVLALAAHLAVPRWPLPVLLVAWGGLELLGGRKELRTGCPKAEHPARAHKRTADAALPPGSRHL